MEPNLSGKKDKKNKQPASHITYHMITTKPMMAMSSLSKDEKKELESYKLVISKHLSNETIQLESDKEEEENSSEESDIAKDKKPKAVVHKDALCGEKSTPL